MTKRPKNPLLEEFEKVAEKKYPYWKSKKL
jgi:hypothetical protein